MAWAGSETTPGPLNFRGCDLRGEWRCAKAHVRVRLPATAPISSDAHSFLASVHPNFNKPRTSSCSRVSARSQVEILLLRPFRNAVVAEYIRHPPSNRNDAGGSPASSDN